MLVLSCAKNNVNAKINANLNKWLSLDFNGRMAFRIRIFGKPEAHVGRRMGVVLCYGEKGDDLNALRDKAKRLAKTVLGTDPYMKK